MRAIQDIYLFVKEVNLDNQMIDHVLTGMKRATLKLDCGHWHSTEKAIGIVFFLELDALKSLENR